MKEFSNLQTEDDSCFLCGNRDTPITEEHVFPKWLQHRYGLWNQTIGLLNETKIQYRTLRIPCCATCNREDLSRLEATVSAAIASGYDACEQLEERLLYLWAGKIYFGVLRKEIDLLADRAREGSASILPTESLRSFSELHLFLQGIRGKHEFADKPPYSVLVCNLHDLGHPRNYCFRDSLYHMTLAMRMGEVGLIVALEDAGLTKSSYGQYVAAVGGRKLHPVQFDELYARVLYQVSLFEGGVTYISSKHASDAKPVRTDVLSGGYLREWSPEEFSEVLEPMVSDWLKSKGAEVQWFAAFIGHSLRRGHVANPDWAFDTADELYPSWRECDPEFAADSAFSPTADTSSGLGEFCSRTDHLSRYP